MATGDGGTCGMRKDDWCAIVPMVRRYVRVVYADSKHFDGVEVNDQRDLRLISR